jgi:hypothetical protein
MKSDIAVHDRYCLAELNTAFLCARNASRLLASHLDPEAKTRNCAWPSLPPCFNAGEMFNTAQGLCSLRPVAVDHGKANADPGAVLRLD